MTVEQFLLWNLLQDQRYELVNGVPVPLRSKVGTRAEHDTITVNLISLLAQQLGRGPCRPCTADTAVRTKIKSVRRPDVTVECAPVEKGSLEARNPIAAFEVLSPTTRKIDRTVKLEEYRRHPALRTIVHIDPDIMDVVVFSRGADGQWSDLRLTTPNDEVIVSGTEARLSLAAVHDGVPLAR